MTVSFHGEMTRKFTAGDKKADMEGQKTVRALVDELGEKYGERFKEFLLGTGTCFFLVNGSGIMTTGGLDTKLSENDRVEILPFVEGG